MTAAAGELLEGLRVLDAGSFIAAPLAAMVLGDWGADVIKLEPPQGDPCRGVGEQAEPGLSATFIAANRGKRSVCLDLDDEAGRDMAARLAAGCDVVVHNLPEPTARRRRLDAASLERERPDAITCTVTAFGSRGPYAGRPALDPVVQALTGLAAVSGEPDGAPMRCAAPVVDTAAGLSAAAGALAALHRRGATGEGARVEVSLLDAALTLQAPLLPLASLLGGRVPRRGNGSYALVGDQFAAADGFVALVVWDDARWRALCEVLELDELADDPRYASNAERHARHAELTPRIAAAIAPHPARAIERRLVDAGIPCAVTQAHDEVVRDPQVVATEAVYAERAFGGGELSMAAGPAWFDGARPRAGAPAPRLGEHTDEVLEEVLDAAG